jgi:hypothetical protein
MPSAEKTSAWQLPTLHGVRERECFRDGKQIRSASQRSPAPGLGANLPQLRASARLVSGVEDAAAGAGLTNSEVRLEGGRGDSVVRFEEEVGCEIDARNSDSIEVGDSPEVCNCGLQS